MYLTPTEVVNTIHHAPCIGTATAGIVSSLGANAIVVALSRSALVVPLASSKQGVKEVQRNQ